MRIILVLLVVLYSGAVFAQSSRPTAIGSKAQAHTQAKGKKGKRAAPPKNEPMVSPDKLLECLSIDDGTKERLDCFDALIAPTAKPKPPKAKSVLDCRFLKEEDERLNCFNGFVEKLPKPKPGR